ncbi:hypothetical protein MNBD_GAMMA03-1957 [hydrothermal vent metagenome]|uniref:4-hydroxybenzoyl-CoA thioesterase family active site n=1 Tax=hydrothermal vent metagenome TaxID=652676 RepID=A0A3B0VPV9_9ZZZZ
MEGFNFKIPIQFRYSDFDMLGHLNSAQYMTLIELGRLSYFKATDWNLKDISNVVASFKIDYLEEIIPYTEVEVHVRVSKLGNKSFRMEYLMASPNEQVLFAKAESTQVCILRKDNSSILIPHDVRKSIASFEEI